MKPKVYLETTIISYLTARPSRDLIIAAHQQLTQDWWDNRRAEFELYISQLVIQEASAGDLDAGYSNIATVAGVHYCLDHSGHRGVLRVD